MLAHDVSQCDGHIYYPYYRSLRYTKGFRPRGYDHSAHVATRPATGRAAKLPEIAAEKRFASAPHLTFGLRPLYARSCWRVQTTPPLVLATMFDRRVDSASPIWSPLRRVLCLAIAVAVVVCTAVPAMSRPARLPGEESKSPIEEEKEREAEEESQGIRSHRQRVKSASETRRLASTSWAATSAVPHRRRTWSSHQGGHRLSNGLLAPLLR